MAGHHELEPLPQHIAWGFLDAAVPAVLRVTSGDTVTLKSWCAADESDLPPDRSLVDPGHLRAIQECQRGPCPHMLTGPVHVEGAEPGDVLQIDILEIKLAEFMGLRRHVPAVRHAARGVRRHPHHPPDH